MPDPIQQTLETLAIHNGAAWLVLAFAAAVLVYIAFFGQRRTGQDNQGAT